jgi:UDP-N-acetylmuramoyl-L-alanyl-D-glutamate--2,6-diaminopimelate ligase
MEIIASNPITVIVDFAHTPQAFENVLPVVRDILGRKSSRIIHVFGATGDRDRTKRPLMNHISARWSDQIILTHEDTYSEDPRAIIADLEHGLLEVKFHQYKKINDRREAIREALLISRPGDIVLLTGVGHQKTLNLGGKEVPWSDQAVARELLARLRK